MRYYREYPNNLIWKYDPETNCLSQYINGKWRWWVTWRHTEVLATFKLAEIPEEEAFLEIL